jgi:hypothetical protein
VILFMWVGTHLGAKGSGVTPELRARLCVERGNAPSLPAPPLGYNI